MNEKPAEWCLLWLAPCIPSSEWAAWAQAIFSAGAVLAAIGVVAWQHHVENQRSLTAAKLAASGLLTQMNQTIGGLQAITQGLQERISGTTTPANQLSHLATILSMLPLPSREDLLALNAALPSCAINMLRASNSVRQVHTALNTLATIAVPGVNEAELSELCRPLHALATDAVATFIEAQQILDSFCP